MSNSERNIKKMHKYQTIQQRFYLTQSLQVIYVMKINDLTTPPIDSQLAQPASEQYAALQDYRRVMALHSLAYHKRTV